MRSSIAVLGAAVLAMLPATAFAHPHVWVDAKAEVVFDKDGRVVAVRNVWRFDDAYSAFASQGLDTDGDGTLSVYELQPLADVNVESLAEFGYFTFMTAGDRDIDFAKPTEYWLQSDGGLLTLYFTVPTKEPVEVRSLPARVDVYDPTLYVDFTFVEDNATPVVLDNAPPGCTSKVLRPEPLDPQTAASLAEIGADQREIPDELLIVTEDRINGVELNCP